MPPFPVGPIDERTGQVATSGIPMAVPGQNPLNPGLGAPGASATGGPAAPGVNNGMSPYTGFASQYAPGQLDNVYDNPWYLLQDVFKGIDTQGPGYQSLRDFGGDPLSLFNIMAGGKQQIDGGAGQFTNFMQNLYKNLGTPGGQGFDARELLSSIFSQKTGADATSSLGRILSAGDMGQQIRTLFNLLRDVSSVGMNPLAATGYQAAVASAGDRYGNEMLKTPAGQTPSIVEWMNKNTPGLVVR